MCILGLYRRVTISIVACTKLILVALYILISKVFTRLGTSYVLLYTQYECYSVEESRWSTEGLRTESLTRDGSSATITCSSSHLTSFAVLVDVGGAKVLIILNLHLTKMCFVYTYTCSLHRLIKSH